MRNLVSAAGAITDTYIYTAFGVELLTSGSTINPFRYVGLYGYYRELVDIYYIRARWLDAIKGRWDSRDPIGFGGGDNLYPYVYSMPQSLLDPDGAKPQKKGHLKSIKPGTVIGGAQTYLRSCSPTMSIVDAKVIATVFMCLASAESSLKPANTNPAATNGTAYGLYMLGLDQIGKCTTDPKCAGKWQDPTCAIKAAINLFISMCTDPRWGPKDHAGPPTLVPLNPLSSIRGNWGCARHEGPDFPQCIKDNGISQEQIKSIPCPTRTPTCGCKGFYPELDRGYIDPTWPDAKI